MAEVKITDLVDQAAIDKIKELAKEMETLLDTYMTTAKELAKGVEINVKVVGDIDKLQTLLVEKSKEAADCTTRLNSVIQQQGQVIANTTNTISRELMEQEKLNKAKRAEFTEITEGWTLLEKVNKTYSENADRMVQIKMQTEKLNAEQKKLDKAYKDGRMSITDYTAASTSILEQTRELQTEKSKLSQVMKAEEKANQTAYDSYNGLSQQLELMKKAYKDMGAADRESETGKELEKRIQNLDAHLKDMAADIGEFQRNVGNYAIAGKSGIVSTESLQKAMTQEAHTVKDLQDQIKILTEARSMLNMSDKDYESTLAAVNAKIAENEKAIAESGQSTNSTKKDLKELVLEIANLTIQYQALSEEERNSAQGQELKSHIQDLTERAGKLKDAISDTNQAIANAASDTRGFDQLGGALQLTIDGFGLATGAAAMLGISSEQLAEIQTKLQAAIAASNAMSKIQNALQKQSAVMQGVNLVQTKLRTTAENLHTAAKGKGTIATGAATVAQWAFNAAANANPIGLLVVAIVACIGVVWGLVKAFAAFFGPSDEQVKKYEQQKKAVEDLTEAHKKQEAAMKAKGATDTEMVNQGIKNREAERDATIALVNAALEAYGKDSDEYKEAVEAKKQADEDFNQSKEDALNYLNKIIHEAEEAEKEERLGTYEYKRQLIKAELEQQKALALTLLQQEKITRQVYNNMVAALDKAANAKIEKINTQETESNNKGGKSAADKRKKEMEDLRKAVQAGEDAIVSIISDSLKRQRIEADLAFQRRRRELEEQLAQLGATETKKREAINRQILANEVQHNNKIRELQYATMERSNKVEMDIILGKLSILEEGSQEELDLRVKLIEKQKQAELIALQKGIDDEVYTEEQAAEMRDLIAVKYNDVIIEATEKFNETMIGLQQERYAKEQSQRDNDYMTRSAELKKQYAAELAEAGANQQKQEAAKKRFDDAMLALDTDYALNSAKAAVDSLEAALQMEGLTDKEREELAAKLAKAKIDYENAAADAAVDAAERAADADTEANNKRMQNAQTWMQKAGEALSAINDLAQQIYENKIAQIEEEQEAYDAEMEANTSASERNAERIDELVNQKVITQEEGEARKRAAEAKTAAKNAEIEKKKEELEKKKAKMKHDQAVWDKANSIAQCGIQTALAIMSVWGDASLPTIAKIAMSAVAGALGAVQLATIIATPIPKYAKGTPYHEGGLAVVGDGGRQEVVTFNGSAWLTPDKPTLIDLPKGAAVIPGIEQYGGFGEVLTISDKGDGKKQPVIVNNDYSRLEDKTARVAFLIEQQTRQQRRIANDQNLNYIKSLL